QSGLGLSHTPLNMNHYANKKSALESMLDMALLMANASQLKAVLEQGPKFTLYSSLNMLLHQTNVISTAADLDRWCWGRRAMLKINNVFITAFGVQPNAGLYLFI
uniref:Uncharacterized protein n=1 Tax=Cyprinus carpio TaxID=7962 RepID=A0A8C1JN40_CYPCA